MTISDLKLAFTNCDEKLQGENLEAMLGGALYRVKEAPRSLDFALHEAFAREYNAANDRDREGFTALLVWYAHASEEERSVADHVLWRLTGSTFARLAWLAMHRKSINKLLAKD